MKKIIMILVFYSVTVLNVNATEINLLSNKNICQQLKYKNYISKLIRRKQLLNEYLIPNIKEDIDNFSEIVSSAKAFGYAQTAFVIAPIGSFGSVVLLSLLMDGTAIYVLGNVIVANQLSGFLFSLGIMSIPSVVLSYGQFDNALEKRKMKISKELANILISAKNLKILQDQEKLIKDKILNLSLPNNSGLIISFSDASIYNERVEYDKGILSNYYKELEILDFIINENTDALCFDSKGRKSVDHRGLFYE